MARTRSPWLGPASRPVAIPDDIDDATVVKATGLVELPLRISWSEPALTYDLSRRADRLRVYEQVLREGTEDDVRYYVNLEELASVLGELVLPPYVRAAWSEWFRCRGQARDFVDLMAVADRYGLDRLLDLASEKDRGFDAQVFAETLNRIDRLPRAAFPLDDTRYEELQVAVGTWKDRALVYAREQERIRGIRRDRGPDLGLSR